jgi:hypothetical protein
MNNHPYWNTIPSKALHEIARAALLLLLAKAHHSYCGG